MVEKQIVVGHWSSYCMEPEQMLFQLHWKASCSCNNSFIGKYMILCLIIENQNCVKFSSSWPVHFALTLSVPAILTLWNVRSARPKITNLQCFQEKS